ncbi:MAG: hypothetical protein Q8P18_13920 [Pseudomonadota bacterium]|nr:hypothetical protein [Pseudomonadota bacterium]
MSRVPLETLLARLDGLTFRLDRGECPDGAEMEAIAAAAADSAAWVGTAGRARLAAAVTRVSNALVQSCARLDERISTTAVGRRAVRAYASANSSPARA